MRIVATGMACAVGLNAAAACAAMRAGITGFGELRYHGNDGEPVIGASLPGLDPGLNRRERLIKLLSMALRDCLNSGSVKHTEPIPLLVGLAEPGRPGGGADWASSIIGNIESELQMKFERNRSCAVPRGHTAAFEALRLAREALQDPAIPACVVCGVDSYINASSLLWLDQHSRLKTAMNSNGVIPGEAAACVLVERTEAEPKQVCVARLVGLGFAQEKAPILSEDPLLGLGLAEAARNALGEAQLPMHEIDYRLSDVTGESYGFKEQALMLSRLLKVRRESLPVWHCADSIGETGAAAGVCQLVIAVHAWRKPYAPGKRAICCTSAVPGHRAVAVLEREVFKDAAREGFAAAGPLDGAWSRGS